MVVVVVIDKILIDLMIIVVVVVVMFLNIVNKLNLNTKEMFEILNHVNDHH
jgi:hypothetical protein